MDRDLRNVRERVREGAAARVKGLRTAAANLEQNVGRESKEFATGFREFLKNYGILALAIAFIIGGAVNRAVQALVNDILMPLIGFFLPQGNWREAVWKIGTVELRVGSFVAAVLEFLIIALVVYLIAKWILKEEKVTKK